MVFTTIGKSGTALAIGTFASNRPQFLALGSGSGANAVGNVKLVAESGVRKIPTTTDITTANEINYIGDWNSLEMSGLIFTEFGMFTESGLSIGSLWNKEGFGAVTFDGSNELQIQLKYEVF